jgi:hypothetical protein
MFKKNRGHYVLLYQVIVYISYLNELSLHESFTSYRAFHNVLQDYKIYDKKIVGSVFTKPVHMEGTTQIFSQKFVFYLSSHFCRWCLCKQKSSGRPLTAEDDVERVRAIFLHISKNSAGTAVKELSIPFASITLS